MRILVTAGPTREPLDPVRFISNRSTGKMGYAVAAAARARGHDVVLISGPVSLDPPDVEVVRVETAAEMLQAVRQRLPWCDALVMTAAVADWRPRHVSPHKLKKREMPGVLELERTEDVLTTLRPDKGSRVFVGFAAETESLLSEAKRKLAQKGLDLIVANDVTRPDSGFGVDTNQVVFADAGGHVEELPLMTKAALGSRIIEWIERKRGLAT